MPDILFGQSYYLRFDPKLWAAMQPYPPLGTLYAASYLRKLGHDVAFFDSMLAESETEWAAALDRHRPKYAIIYEDNFNYLSKMCLLRMRDACFKMSDMAKQHDCTVIVCGSDATDHYDLYFENAVDYVIPGEGEVTLGELISHLTHQKPARLQEINGLAWKQTSGASQRTPSRPVMQDLDALPFPAWDLVDVERYRKIWLEHHGYYSVNMVTTRGCPYHCNWCAKPVWGQRYNVRSPENVVDELTWIKQNFSPDHIWFADDIMGLQPGWIQKFADLVETKNVRIPFKSLNRPDLLLVGDTIAALKRAGCKTVWMGAESGSQKILDAMDKGTTVQQIRAAARKVKAAGIEVAFFLQFGYPGENRADIKQTLTMILECDPDDIGISVSYPLPGTRFYEKVKSQLQGQRNWRDSDDLAMLYRGPFTTAFYRKLHTVVHKNFRLNKITNDMRTTLKHPVRIRHFRPRRLLAAAYYAATLPFENFTLNRLAKLPNETTAARNDRVYESAPARPGTKVV